jgi:hypothetical protein
MKLLPLIRDILVATAERSWKMEYLKTLVSGLKKKKALPVPVSAVRPGT